MIPNNAIATGSQIAKEKRKRHGLLGTTANVHAKELMEIQLDSRSWVKTETKIRVK